METFIRGLGVFVEDHFLDISPLRFSRSTDPLLRNGKGNGETRGKQTSLDPQHLDIFGVFPALQQLVQQCISIRRLEI